MTSDPFLSRWSKRKQAARSAEQAPDNATAQPEPRSLDVASEPGAPKLGDDPPTAPETELTPEEVAKLPPLGELTADTDISMFLRKGVPVPLRNAALRRMWSLDPKIRDFIGDARDYAYDWNMPGGVPGYGPLSSTEDVARMAARIVGGDASASGGHGLEGEKAPSAPSKDREQRSSADADASHTDRLVPDENPALFAEAERPCEAGGAANVLTPPSLDIAATRQSASASQMPCTDEPAKPASARRHGGAMPL